MAKTGSGAAGREAAGGGPYDGPEGARRGGAVEDGRGPAPSEGRSEAERLVGWLLAAGLFAFYACLSPRAPYLLDSAELAAASFGLGVAHPPGEALALLVGKLFCLVPLGPVAFRIGLSQAAAGAAAGVLVYAITLALLASSHGPPLDRRARLLLASGAALVFGLAPGAVSAAIRPEVYALQTALSVAAIASARDAAVARDPRGALLAALLVGLGLANHPLVAGLAAGAVALAAAPLLGGPDRRWGRHRLVSGAALAALVGALVLVYVPLRTTALFAAGDGARTLVWGDARTWRGLLWVLSAETFADKAAVVHGTAEPGALPFALLEELGLVVGLSALLGLAALLRTPASRPDALALAAGCAGAIGAALLGGFDPANPDQRGYLGGALALLASLGAVGFGHLAAAARRPAIARGAALMLLALALARAPHAASRDLRGVSAAAAFIDETLANLPARAALLSSYFQTAFLAAYARAVEGARPDVAHVHLGFVRGPGYAERLARAEPDLAPLLAAAQSGRLDRRLLDGAARALRFEPDARLSPSIAAALVPAGYLWQWPHAPVRPPATSEGLLPLPAGAFLEASGDRETRGFFAYRALMDAGLACAQGRRGDTALRLGELARLVPEDAHAAALAARCGR